MIVLKYLKALLTEMMQTLHACTHCPGYTNVAVHPEDVLMSVDGIDIEAKSVMQIHALIRGRNHSTVNLTLERHVTRKPHISTGRWGVPTLVVTVFDQLVVGSPVPRV